MVEADRELVAQRPVVIANPTHDHPFVALAERLVGEGAATPDELQARLRTEFPRTIVRERQLAGETMRMWYAYRDGHWVDSRDDQAL
jgi:hypothetical protein